MDMIEILKIILQTFVPVITIYLYLRYGKKLQSSEVVKTNSLADVAFLYNATPKIYTANGKKIVDIEVKITNVSTRKLAILAIIVKFKPLVNTKKADDDKFISFESLPEFEQNNDFEKRCSLLDMKNIGYSKNGLWQTSISGISLRRSVDIVDDKFCEKYPLIMAQIIIYGSAIDYLDKTHFPKYQIGELRIPWISYVESKNQGNYDFFSRVNEGGFSSKELTLKHGERVLLNPDNTIDVKNTIKFNPILRSTINSTIEQVIDLQNMKNKDY